MPKKSLRQARIELQKRLSQSPDVAVDALAVSSPLAVGEPRGALRPSRLFADDAASFAAPSIAADSDAARSPSPVLRVTPGVRELASALLLEADGLQPPAESPSLPSPPLRWSTSPADGKMLGAATQWMEATSTHAVRAGGGVATPDALPDAAAPSSALVARSAERAAVQLARRSTRHAQLVAGVLRRELEEEGAAATAPASVRRAAGCQAAAARELARIEALCGGSGAAS